MGLGLAPMSLFLPPLGVAVHDWLLWLHMMRLLALGDSCDGKLPILLGCDGAALYLYAYFVTRMAVPVWVLWPTLCIGLDLTSLARLWLEYCMLFWELCLCFVQHRIALLPDAPSGVVSIGVSKRSASRPHGRVSLVEDAADVSVPAPTAASGSPSGGLPTEVALPTAPFLASDSVAASLAPKNSTVPADRLVSSAPTSSVQATAVTKDIPHDPMVHIDSSDM
ncbi:hypothetical protein V6N12_019247 [Hibiscus sabdariffa]|uniref:Transmembrane protein n=1 Tax=Hibiscus sabdariffa TaxID=183260 RepID=A0ABR2C704_9ROSI